MSHMNVSHPGLMAAQAGTDARLSFIRRTYIHLFGAILVFTLIEIGLFKSGLADQWAPQLFNGNAWIFVFAAFLGVSYLANKWAMSDASPGLQYAGLGVFIVAMYLGCFNSICNGDVKQVIACLAVVCAVRVG